MARPFPTDNPLLQGGFEPIRMECDNADLFVHGEIPSELIGTLYRIGPNPQFAPRGRYNPLQADGMIHAFHIADGRVAYRNRWVRTRQWTLERSAGRALFGTSGDPRDVDPEVADVRSDGVANTHIVWHAGRLLALEEGHGPIEIDPVSLDTIGPWNFDHQLPGNMTAHPKIDPLTGEMLFFANFPSRAFTGEISFYVADAHGRIVRHQSVQGPFPALVHDFAITHDYVIFAVCPVTLSIERARAGGPPIAWEPYLGTHVGVLARDGRAEDTRWYTGDACMAWHSMNAFSKGERIFIDVCQQEAPAFPPAHGPMPDPSSLRQYLTRWTIDRSEGEEFGMQRLSEVVCEYPRIDERRAGLAYRYGYVACIGGPGTDDMFHRAIGRFDHDTLELQTFHFGDRCAVSEPVFVAKAQSAGEGEGYLLATVFDETRNASHLVVLDAQHVSGGPIARADLDHRVPMGFHGSWRQARAGQ
ncbi:MAG TPA: carotenoid oxygenase family protein [Pseudomonadales bacterium]|nr:carotenoid oxygenase family protein [Pseudomonadales bacterium]